ncbi:exonuclease subunit SbcD [Azotobacter vinelandii CA]|uniref:Nuclease SbcCD subunit D n=2 Tax=Azotobacter vinelandii TaxID=354 RepID=C1DPF1_AZOVD|nr:exonuclease subunit SbcD [Azotobacter vinelandii]ACO77383.1 Exonuclease, SbcD-type [Azotobacter vinelandii DJ]AGK13196.1 exonuclease subunit SbcD [Azotobacter vinelandii CA]AGK19764.1 exonuclease subunit SbcD [Azotobacter vinelandii CA6]SFX84969.1 Exodeoxyribonuclease I subunit D [Azotobacter vinelandii]GLK61464.1 nuclease SbcCD subunit D [Azotobacter vinelandii]
MRLLHTSDWHLGQHFMGKTRQAEHRAFCDWLVERVREHAVDALIVAGDLFDSGAPPSHAREQYNRFIVALRATGARLVVLGGNHDSVAMLGESRGLLACLDTWVIPGVAADPAEQLLLLPRRDGAPGALLCAIPFIRPRDVLKSEAGQSADAKLQALQAAIREHYRALFALAEARRRELGGALPIVATGHLTTVGASASESVREIYVGSLEAFPTDAFPPAAYVALGHIHRPQQVAGLEHIRYSGSPIPLSFDEARQCKEVLLVDLGEDGLEAVTPLPVPCFQPLLTLRGDLAELAGAVVEAAAGGSAERPVWLEVRVVADEHLPDLPARVAALCAGLPVEVLRIRRERGDAVARLCREARETLDELSPEEVFEQRLAGAALDEALAGRLRGLHRQVLDELREERA